MIPSAGAVPADLRPERAAEEPPLRRYLQIVTRRAWFVVLAVVVCTGAAVAYVLTATEVYEAHADVLVTPVPDEQTAVLGLGLIRRAADPTRDVTTAARLIENNEIARRVARDLRSTDSPDALLKRISVDPVAQSSIVAITASGDSPREARQLANAFGAAAVAERTERLHRELDPAIASLQERIAAVGATGGDTAPLSEQLGVLESLRSGADPTLRMETPAAEPTAPVSPRKRSSIAGGIFTGLLLGIAGAFVLSALDPRDQREGRLRSLGLEVLANVPTVNSRVGRHAFEEAFRFLRTMIRFASPEHPYRSIAITSALEQEGKTTTAHQLAFATLEAGQSVVLVEADAYRPVLRKILDAADRPTRRPHRGLLDYLTGEATLDDIIEPTDVPGLTFVPAGTPPASSMTGLLERRRGREFVTKLADHADLVILDCPPIGPRSDAVLIAAVTDAVVLVVDMKRSTENDVTDSVRRLRSARSNVLGVVLNRDTSPAAEYDYHQYRPNENGAHRRFSPRALLRPGSRTRDD